MKKSSLLLVLAFALLPIRMSAQESAEGKNIVTIHLSILEGGGLVPGAIVEKLGGEKRYEIDSLVVTGYLEESMIARDHKNGLWATFRDCCINGKLRGIDFSGCIMERVSYYAFTGASPYDRTPIHYITLPKLSDSHHTNWIGKYAFANTELRWINISEVTWADESAFANSDLDGEYDMSNMELVFPHAFSGCKLRGTLNLNAHEIGEGAFEDAGWIEKVVLSSDRLEQISDNAFNHCCRLKEVVLPEGVRTIGRNAFQGDVREINLPSSVEYISDKALQGLHVESMTIPEKVMELYASTFMHSDIKEINWPSYIKKIGACCFMYNRTVEELDLPDCIMDIDSLAFFQNENLKKVILPEKLQHLGLGTFANCTKLAQVVAKSPVPPYTEEPRVLMMELGHQVSPFNNIVEDAVLYVPKGAKEAYEQAEYWQDFKTIIEMDENTELTGIDETIVDDTDEDTSHVRQGIYTMNGVKVEGSYESLPRGMYIINGRKVVR